MKSYLLAQVPLGNISGIGLGGTVAAGPQTALMYFMDIISTLVGVLTIGGGLWFFFQLILSGYRFISSGGDKQANQEAQKRMTNAIIGIVVVVAAYALNGLIGYILGLETIDIGGLIYNNIHP